MLARGKTLGSCEFRRGGASYVLDYASLSGGVHHVYPQQFLVADLIDCLRAAGGCVRFATPVASIPLGDRPIIHAADGTSLQVD